MSMVHVVAIEIATLKDCREVFVLLNGCKEWRNACGRLGMKDIRSRLDLLTQHPAEEILFYFFSANGDKLLKTKLLCIPSQE